MGAVAEGPERTVRRLDQQKLELTTTIYIQLLVFELQADGFQRRFKFIREFHSAALHLQEKMHKHQQVRVSLDGIVFSNIANSENLQSPSGECPIRGLMILANNRAEDPVPISEGNLKFTANAIGESEPCVLDSRSVCNKGSLDHHSESEFSAIGATKICRR